MFRFSGTVSTSPYSMHRQSHFIVQKSPKKLNLGKSVLVEQDWESLPVKYEKYRSEHEQIVTLDRNFELY